MQSEIKKIGEGTHQTNSGWKLVRLHRKSQLYNCVIYN